MSKLRAEITKGEEIRYISHLDFARAIERAIRRANLQVAYSEGFNPHMKISFASALAVGITSDAEFLDIEMTEDIPVEAFQEKISGQLPPGIVLKRAKYMLQKTQALMAVVNRAEYTIIVPTSAEVSIDDVEQSVERFNDSLEVIYIRESPKGKKEIDVKEYIAEAINVSINKKELTIKMAISITPGGSIKPGEVLKVLVDKFDLKINDASALINRTGIFIANEKALLSPIDL
ncbi:TIGR03936 family radical SAM-associated protein [Dendrosporobacter sp. 1207_IL3150]|uniref:TIGR03936 family radical SAM-associated protein n=1 Tax=Dendrosporobacter sp. 1207_IL3150 TaxID=3084054 RepID=UPI002FD9E36F